MVVAPARHLVVRGGSYCLEIRDESGVAPTIAEEHRERVIAAHAVSHQMLRVYEAVRAEHGEAAIDALYDAWGPRFFGPDRERTDAILGQCLDMCGLDRSLLDAAGDEKWDAPITESMEVAWSFGGEKTQTPTIAVYADPPHGFKGPVMAPAPTGAAALELWDAIQVLSRQQGFFEITRPRANIPRPVFA
jgi:hypothetical protein